MSLISLLKKVKRPGHTPSVWRMVCFFIDGLAAHFRYNCRKYSLRRYSCSIKPGSEEQFAFATNNKSLQNDEDWCCDHIVLAAECRDYPAPANVYDQESMGQRITGRVGQRKPEYSASLVQTGIPTGRELVSKIITHQCRRRYR